MLETNNYVRCLLIDFSRSFDVIDHGILLNKLYSLKFSENLLKWIVSLLSNRTQVTYLNGSILSIHPINKDKVQGSGIGPTLFTLMVIDLRTVSASNKKFKYADDVTLISLGHSDL